MQKQMLTVIRPVSLFEPELFVVFFSFACQALWIPVSLKIFSAPQRCEVRVLLVVTLVLKHRLSEVWSDQSRTAFYLEWEVALAKCQAKLDIIPQSACDEIVTKARVENIDFAKLKQQTELIGYPVLGVVQQIVALCADGLGEWCHWGATTQDVTDSATVLATRRSFKLIEADLDHIMASVARLAETHRLQPMAARSNLQQAVPISFGFKMARLLATLQRHKQRLAQLRERVLTLQFTRRGRHACNARQRR